MNSECLTIAIPSKGVLSKLSRQLVECLGFTGSAREYVSFNGSGEIRLLLARAQDIPQYVERGVADLGITGSDLVAEEQVDVQNCFSLPYGFCRLVYAAKKGGTGVTRIATAFPNLAKQYVSKKGVVAEVIVLSGAVEASVASGVADAIIDLTATGKTLEANGLVELDELLESSAVVILNKKSASEKKLRIDSVLKKIQGDWKFFYSPLNALAKEDKNRLVFRGKTVFAEARGVAKRVFDEVAVDRDDGLCRFSREFDKVVLKPSEFVVGASEIKEAYSQVSPSLISSLKAMAQNIARFARKEIPQSWEMKLEGGFMGKKVVPLDSVGVYSPGGTAAYPSSVLMGVIPAKTVGVPKIVLCTPCNEKKQCNPSVLVAADIAGANQIFKLGGAQAIAGMSLGTRTIPRVNKIVGPGNAFVTAAKLEAFYRGLAAIDCPAGPSELVIIADETAVARFVAADLLAQAEHGVDSSTVLLTTSTHLGDAVIAELKKQAMLLPRREIALKSFENNGAILIAKDLDEAISFANEYAPEHLELCVDRPVAWMQKVRNAGAVFLGNYSCEAAGDYGAGPNHVLPTGAWAKSFSGLSARDFVRDLNYLKLEKRGLENLRRDICEIAEAEGLQAHAKSVQARFVSS